MTAARTCGACLKAIGHGDLTRTAVVRGYYDDVDRPAPLRLDVVELHVDCDDPQGEDVFTCYPRVLR